MSEIATSLSAFRAVPAVEKKKIMPHINLVNSALSFVKKINQY